MAVGAGTTWVAVQTFVFYYVTEDLGRDIAYFGALKSAAKLGGFGSITLVGVGIVRLGLKTTMVLAQATSAACIALMALSPTWGVYGYVGTSLISDAVPMISSIWVSSLALHRGTEEGERAEEGDDTGRKASVFAMKKVIGRAINAIGLFVFGALARYMNHKPTIFAICSAVGFAGTLCFAFMPPPLLPMAAAVANKAKGD